MGEEHLAVRAISIDSRTLQSGDLFFAIRGPRFDGHDFVAQAYEQGACGAVVSERRDSYPVPLGKGLIYVPDTTQALQDVAAFVRKLWNGPVIGITGSTGKTTTKDFIATLLERTFSVFKSPGNLNNLYGLPLVLSKLDRTYNVAVLEMAMSRRGEIAKLCEIAQPNVGVYTNIAPVHLEFFSSVEEIAEAKAELLEGMRPDGVVIYNSDDPLLRRIVARFKGEKVSYGLEHAHVRASNIESVGLEKTTFRIAYGGRVAEAEIPLVGVHNVLNALAAVTVAQHMGVSMEEITERLRAMRPTAMRGEILNFQEGFTVVDDSYNSNPRALREMVRTIDGASGFKRKIILAGEMLELGAQSRELHRECGRFIARSSANCLICVQGEAKSIGEGAILERFDESAVYFFPESEAAGRFLSQMVRPGDLVLIKGSRGVHTERVVAILKETFHLR